MSTNQLQGDQGLGAQQPNPVQQQAQDTASTPAGGAAAGMEPDQAKMVGTPQEKRTRLSRQQRYTKGPSESQKAAGESAADRANRMQEVGALGSRLDAKIQSYIDSQAQAALDAGVESTAGVDPTALEGLGLTSDKVPQAQTALEEFLASPRTENDIAALAGKLEALQPGLGANAQDAGWLNSMYQGVGDIGSKVASDFDKAIEDGTATLGSIPGLFDDSDMTELTELLGVDPSDLTINELNSRLEEIEAQEFSEVESLRAELVTASPQRRQQIMRQLQGMAQTGEWQADRQFDEVQRALEEGDSIEFAGEEFSLEELLSDDGISRIIEQAATDEEYLEDLMEQEPELGAWIAANIQMIEDLQDQVGDAAIRSGELQAEYDEYLSGLGLSEELAEIFLGETAQFAGTDTLSELQASVEGNALLSSAIEHPELKDWLTINPSMATALVDEEGNLIAPGLVDYISQGEQDIDRWIEGKSPEETAAFLQSISDLSADEIEDAIAASDAYAEAAGLHEGIWGNLGIRDADGFIEDPVTAGKIQMASEHISAIAESRPEILSDESFRQMVRDGVFDIDDMKAIADSPENYFQAKEAWELERQFDGAPDWKKISLLTGGKFDSVDGLHILLGTSDREMTPEAKAAKAALLALVPEYYDKEFQKWTPKEEQDKKLFDALTSLIGSGKGASDILSGGDGKEYVSPEEKTIAIFSKIGSLKDPKKKKSKNLQKKKVVKTEPKKAKPKATKKGPDPKVEVGKLKKLEEKMMGLEYQLNAGTPGAKQQMEAAKKEVAKIMNSLTPEQQQTVRTIQSFNDQIAAAEAQGKHHIVKALYKQREEKTGIPAPTGGGGKETVGGPLGFLNDVAGLL